MSRLRKLTGEISGRHVSVVLVHGLGGQIDGTWRQPATSGPLWFASDVPGVATSYDAPISRWSGRAMHLIDRATNLLERLWIELEGSSLVLTGHSLGSLLTKQLLRTAESEVRRRTEAANPLGREKRAAFSATPHSGSGLAVLADRLRIVTRPSTVTSILVRNELNLPGLLWYRDWASSAGVTRLILIGTKPIKSFGAVSILYSSLTGTVFSRPISIDADHIETYEHL